MTARPTHGLPTHAVQATAEAGGAPFPSPGPAVDEALQAGGIGVWEIDLASGTLRGSPVAGQLWNLPHVAAATVTDLLNRIDPADQFDFESDMIALKAGGRICRRLRMSLPDGRVRWLWLQGEALARAGEAPARASGITADVSALTPPEADLASDRDHAERLAAISELTGGMLHDLNNMFTVVGSSYWLIDRLSTDPRVREATAAGAKATEHGMHLLRRLLGFVRQRPSAATTIEVAGLLAGIDLFIRQACGPRILCDVQVRPGTWHVIADARGLETALIALAVEARESLPQGGTLRVVAENVAAEVPGGMGHVGFSISAERGERVADAPGCIAPGFFTDPGSRFGLTVARAFAERSGGNLLMAGAPGEAARVTLLLPCVGGADRAGTPAQTTPHGGATILLVDDDPALRTLSAETLVELGYAVLEAGGSATAVLLARTEPAIDLAILDVTMPGRTGTSLAALLQVERPGLPVLFISGDPDAREALPGEDLLAKPFSGPDLAATVLRKLGRRSAAAPRPDPLAARLHDARLRGVYQAWTRLAVGGSLPSPEAIDLAALDVADHAALVEVDPRADPIAFRFLRVGRSLTERLGRDLAGEPLHAQADAMIGSIRGAYARCARTRRPGLSHVRFSLDESPPVRIERLVLPLSTGGGPMTHLLSIAIIDSDAETTHDIQRSA
ncbi:Response regulator [Rhodovastum atsumiense]|uniref:Response regulator n=1 Tax=Rhodovastum atsumiense TaxID=504468 RepID=A0A5M6IZS1_9PROT|nr:response regulator [Rhodovastum atsumiense]KAA5612875.1 response regulator [Rhodovastum atsumiense]CAH2601050.1 Response regulator [Rhodovastum atsumiense]